MLIRVILAAMVLTGCVSALRAPASELIPLFPVAQPETARATVRLTVIDRRADGNLPIEHQPEAVIRNDVARLLRNRVELALAESGVGVSTGGPLRSEVTVELLEYRWDWERANLAYRASADVKLKVYFHAATGEERWNTLVTGSAEQLEKGRDSGPVLAEQLEVALGNAFKSAHLRGVFGAPAMSGTPPER